jgi:hypothetical protein
MKANSREMEKYKRGFIDEVRWYDANDDTKVVYTHRRLGEVEIMRFFSPFLLLQ